jgi:hypothetical protein
MRKHLVGTAVCVCAAMVIFPALMAQVSGHATYDRAVKLFRQHQYDQAITLLQQVITRDPNASNPRDSCDGNFPCDDYFPHLYLADAFFMVHQYDKAQGTLAKVRPNRLPKSLLSRYNELTRELDLRDGDAFRVDIDEPALFRGADLIAVNGHQARVRSVDESARVVRFLGEETQLQEGVNYFNTPSGPFRMWYEGKKLARFGDPYTHSYAVIAAVGDYQRKRDPQLGPALYMSVPGMVERASELADALTKLGFPEQNIKRLFDRDATSTRIEEQLRRFWRGGDLENADRVFVYFGGHGDVEKDTQSPFLVTYDVDAKRQALTTLLMRELTQIYLTEIRARHVLVALDSCSSGLALPRMLESEPSKDQLKEFTHLAVIHANAESPTREILVAGTGEERALYATGGVFTKALLAGIRGEADFNHDNIIDFEELGEFVRDAVVVEARRQGVDQRPQNRTLSGDGRFMFLIPPK